MENENTLFEETILPHLDAAYNLARWLTGNEPDARDMVQESFLRAFKFFGRFRGGDARSWLLTIVRNTVYTALRQRRTRDYVLQSDDAIETFEDPAPSAGQILERAATIDTVRAAIAQLPVEFREVIVLREMEDFSYKEIADLVGVPIGTVMSRLARGRRQLQTIILQGQEHPGGVAS
ncbi:MAG: sigma-70 family RNA polymerase sigma factor [Chthoniobacterales bacterium]